MSRQRMASPPDRREIERLTAKWFDVGAPRIVFMPYCGEYGCFIMFHLRFVYATPASHRIVCCRRGEEVYYPNANAFEYDWELPGFPDKDRHGVAYEVTRTPAYRELADRLSRKHQAIAMYSREFHSFMQIHPELKPTVIQQARADVLVAPRLRALAPERNYPHWPAIATALAANGYTVGVIGRPDVSVPISAARVRSWDFQWPDNAVVELMKTCRLYIGTDTGPTHLAGLLSTPTLVFRDSGYLWAAHQASRGPWIEVPDGWQYPEDVVEQALLFLGKSQPENTFLTEPAPANLGFGDVVYLNLESRPDRRTYIEDQLRKNGIAARRFPAVKATPAQAAGFDCPNQAGCLLSHRAIIADAKARGLSSVLIVEDDAFFTEPFRRRAARIIKTLAAVPWDLFYFHGADRAPLEDRRYILRVKGVMETHAVAVHARFYDRYLAEMVPEKHLPIDLLLCRAQAEKWVTRETLVVQRRQVGIAPDDSDIVPTPIRQRGVEKPSPMS